MKTHTHKLPLCSSESTNLLFTNILLCTLLLQKKKYYTMWRVLRSFRKKCVKLVQKYFPSHFVRSWSGGVIFLTFFHTSHKRWIRIHHLFMNTKSSSSETLKLFQKLFWSFLKLPKSFSLLCDAVLSVVMIERVLAKTYTIYKHSLLRELSLFSIASI